MPPPVPSSPTFSFVMTMVSVVLSLGLTHLVSGNVQLFQPKRKVRFSFVHAAWTIIVYLMILDMWLSLWSLRTETDWRLTDLILILLGVLILYVISVLLTPPRDEDIDLSAFHLENRRRYLGVGIAYELWGAWVNIAVLPENFDIASLMSTVPMIACMLAAMVFTQPWVQRLAAAGALVNVAIYYVMFFSDISA